MSTREEIFDFMNANPACFLATAEDNTPHVRAMGMYKADERGILIQTSIIRGMLKEIVQNPKVELCFSNGKKVIRVSGTAEFLEDQGLKEEIVKTRPFLKQVIDTKGYDAIKVFRIADPVASVWTMAAIFEPAEMVKL